MPPARWSIDHHLVTVEPGRLRIEASPFVKAIGTVLNDRFCSAKASLAVCLLPVLVEGGGTDVVFGPSGLNFHGENSAVSL